MTLPFYSTNDFLPAKKLYPVKIFQLIFIIAESEIRRILQSYCNDKKQRKSVKNILYVLTSVIIGDHQQQTQRHC
jgi:hypothetical protein